MLTLCLACHCYGTLLGMSKFLVRQVVSLMKNKLQQNQNLLLKVDLGSTFRNNFL